MLAFFIFMKVTPEDARKLNLPAEGVNKTPSGEIFVKPNLQKVIFILVLFILNFMIWIHEL